MYMNIAALLLLLGLTYIWMTRGFFNSLMHMLCTIGAGAIAFAVWEPVATLLLSLAPNKGFLTVLAYIAWGAGLLLPFGLSLLVLRTIADKVVGSNIKAIGAVEYIGGGICGAVSASITVGIIVIGIGFLPLGTGFMGFRPINYTEKGAGSGSLVRAGGLWVPVDRLAAGLYGHLSETSLRSGEPLAQWHPDVDLEGYAINTSVADGKASPSIKPDDFKIRSTYIVGADDGTSKVSDLLIESEAADALSQGYQDIDGETVQTGTLLGIVVEFSEGAKESNGQVVMGNGQASLILRGESGEAKVAHPVALISQARSDDASLYGRWKFDGEDVFISSVGGSSKATMVFEFVVPTGFTPEAFSIKGARVLLPAERDRTFATASARFAALGGGALLGGASLKEVDTTDAATVNSTDTGNRRNPGESPVVATNSLGFSFEVRQKGSLELGENNRVERGTVKFRPQDVNGFGDRNVIVNSIAVSPDVVIVQVNVSPTTAASLLGRVARSVDRVLPPQLVDTNGTVYPAVGYIYRDDQIIELSYDPSQQIRGLAALPSLSSARTDQSLELIFRCSKGVELKYYSIGPKVILELNPPLPLDRAQD
ncbi:MAG: hypothetical protein H6810_09650 [Phycisphaeraceae bacterium]|nr:MAG: hypothetical protein H6810_09650 [Phycisphaeraceae bacterium]